MIRFRARRWREEELAERLCQLIYGQGSVRRDDHGRRWHIGDANDWWLHPQGNEEYLLHYRYPIRGRMIAFADTLAWLLHLELIEIG